VDLSRIIDIDKPMLRVRYELEELGKPDLTDVIRERLAQTGARSPKSGARGTARK
jgi:predicted GTPase